jgi:HK97 family phage major capsid protein
MKSVLALGNSAASLAVAATPGLSVRPRGLIAVRNEGGDVMAAVREMNKAFTEFKDTNDARIKALEAGRASDPLDVEKVNRISAEISALQKGMDEANKAMASLRLGAGGADAAGDTPEARAHAKAFNTWFRRGDRAVADNELKDLAVKARLTTDSDPDGGYVVPEEMSSTIDRVLGTVSAMRSLAQVMTISTGTYKKLMNMGGAGHGWVGEREARTETDTPVLKGLDFEVMELYANPAATQQLLDDARVDIGQWLADEVATTFAEQEGNSFIVGDGNKKPRGILSYTNVANASYAWGSIGFIATGNSSAFLAPSSSASPADAFISLFYALKQGYRNGASWLTSDAVMNTIRQFKDGQGNYIWAPPSGPEGVPTILGKPVATDDSMQALGANAFPVAFANFSRAYLIVDRFGVRVLRDPYTNKPYVMFYTTKRVGGGVQNFEAIKLMRCST